MLMQAPKPPDIVQIRKLILSPKDWDGNIWNNSDNNNSGKADPLHPPETLQFMARPNIKTELQTCPQGGRGPSTRNTIPFNRIQMANLQGLHSRKPGETET